MWDFLERIFGRGFMPHGHCYLWSAPMVWTQVTSNLLIGLAYLSISGSLAYLVWRVKLLFSWVYLAFGVFILACGFTHFFDIATVWHPIYWADAGMRVLTAVASVGTAIMVFPLVPKALAIAKVSALARERGEKLEEANTDLRRALAETSRYRLLVDSVKDATFILDPGGRVVTWNAAAQRLKGYDAAEIIGKHFSSFYPEEDKAAGKPARELEIATATGIFEEDGWRVRKDASRFLANVTITAMRDQAGAVVGFAKVVRDLTERLQNEERLGALAAENAMLAEKARLQEFQERFLAVLGHDLRNPLSSIDMAAALLRRKSTDPGVTSLATRIGTSSLRMSRMIAQILDLTRSRLAGGLAVSPESMDLHATLGAIVEELRTANPGRAIELRSTPLVGTWDRDRLEQLFSNLIGNAVAHGDDKPVRIEARLAGDEVQVDVHNDGPPIPEDLRAVLFAPFRRGSRDSRTAKTAGLGLGLYISHEIVVAHGGRLDAQSSSSEGTTFHVRLPRIAKAQVTH